MIISKIEKASITKVEQVHDYFQIFSTEYILNIYNPFHVTFNNITVKNYDILLGKMVKAVELTEREALVLELEDGIIINISLTDDDYLGPEAVQIGFNSGEIVVF